MPEVRSLTLEEARDAFYSAGASEPDVYSIQEGYEPTGGWEVDGQEPDAVSR
jgi:hypothetical protein